MVETRSSSRSKALASSNAEINEEMGTNLTDHFPQKKQKMITTNMNDVASKLPKLLQKLTGKVPSLSILAGTHVHASTLNDEKKMLPAEAEILRHSQRILLEKHVGKRDHLFANAIRFADRELTIAIYESDNSNNGFFNEIQFWEHEYYPSFRGIKGPEVETSVWMDMFLGRERSHNILTSVPKLKDFDVGDQRQPLEVAILKALRNAKTNLTDLELLTNVLEYLFEKASSSTITKSDLFRFCIVYGLDGAMEDVLRGAYTWGNAGGGVLTIDSTVPLDEKPLERGRLLGGMKVFFPAYAVGAILGHCNVVVKALNELGGKIDVPYGKEVVPYGKEAEYMEANETKFVRIDDHNIPSLVLVWTIRTNRKEVVRCLVSECGFQFRWIQKSELNLVFERIIGTSPYESSPFWKGDIDEDALMWAGGSRNRCRMRSAASYKEQMKMLDILIELGFPFKLLFNTEPNIELERKLREEKKLETNEDYRAFKKMQSKEEMKALDRAFGYCSAYNDMQRKEPDQLYLHDFYQKLKSRWDKQESPQEVKLEQYEALDSCWRNHMRKQNKSNDDSDDNFDYSSDYTD